MNWESVTYAYISEPVEFRHLKGNPIDFRKTFDVRGQGPDEMLQLYMHKAHLCDDVERMPSLQRRTYVYDIIRSHKEPGYWVPPCMQVSSDIFAQPPPAVLPPPAVRASPGSERRYFADGASLNMSQSSSSNSLSSLPGPSFATSVVVSNKGSKYEISGPVNFQHVSGDVTRDRTRNAFDLNVGANDNVLKKYMMERGIAEEDVAGMQRQELIKKIVHSDFTWMPTKQDMHKAAPKPPKLVYATISTNNQITPPPSPPPPTAVAKQPPPPAAYSNYATVTSRFVDISDMEMPGTQSQHGQQEVGSVIPVQVQQAQPSRAKIPPPPSAVTAVNTHAYPAAIEVRPSRPKTPNETYATIATPQSQRKVGSMRVPPPAPPKPTIVPSENKTTVQYAPIRQPPPPPVKTTPLQLRVAPVQVSPKPKTPAPAVSSGAYIPPPAPVMAAATGAPPPPPPPPAMTAATGAPVPPPPPPALAMGAPMPPPPPPMGGVAKPLAIKKSEQPKVAAAAGDDRDAFLESIRKGVSLKKVDQKAATISGIKPRAEKKPPPMDFMSELKLGITLRRVKNPKDNPYSDSNSNADESQV